MKLTKKDARQLIRLLGLLQDHLESAIDSALVPGTSEAMPEDQAGVAKDRKDWRLAEALKVRIRMQIPSIHGRNHAL